MIRTAYVLLSAALAFQSFQAQATSEEAEIRYLYTAGQAAYEQGSANANLAVAAVLGASRLSGSQIPVLQGTLKQFAPDPQAFNYEPQPQDALVVQFYNGQRIEFRFQDFRGENLNDSSSFLSGNHSLSFVTNKDGGWNLQITSAQWNGQKQASLKGTAIQEQQSYQVDLNLAGTYFANNDTTGSEFRLQLRLTGTILSSARSFRIDESTDGRVIVSRDRSSGKQTSASSIARVLNSSMTTANETYTMQNARSQKAFKNGKPSDYQFWLGTSGMIQKNGQAIAELKAAYEQPYAKIKAFFANGSSADLERWLIDTNPTP